MGDYCLMGVLAKAAANIKGQQSAKLRIGIRRNTQPMEKTRGKSNCTHRLRRCLRCVLSLDGIKFLYANTMAYTKPIAI